MSEEELIERAVAARERAIAPNSGFKVGAALLSVSGRVFEGCNIENGTLNLGLCAERVALIAALAAGERSFEAMALAAEWEAPITPCGACRQLLWDFAGDLTVYSSNMAGKTESFSLASLLPNPFKARAVPRG
jgi:cytidine deaminase